MMVLWAARDCDDRIPDVRAFLKVEKLDIEQADLASPRHPHSIIVLNSQYPCRAFLSEYEKNGTPFVAICLDRETYDKIKSNTACEDIFIID
jgi:hypothetical protein